MLHNWSKSAKPFTGDWSGISVALSSNGTVVTIGALFNDGGGTDAGHVRVYINAGVGW